MEHIKQEQTEKKKVLVNFDNEAVSMADMMTAAREFDSRSSYLRKLVKDDYRKWQRKIQKAQAA
jgi:Arc/MetJ-type ribon-helix-helix transcriptional regulator